MGRYLSGPLLQLGQRGRSAAAVREGTSGSTEQTSSSSASPLRPGRMIRWPHLSELLSWVLSSRFVSEIEERTLLSYRTLPHCHGKQPRLSFIFTSTYQPQVSRCLPEAEGHVVCPSANAC